MPHTTPAFIAEYQPVALAARHDGWTDIRQYRFLFALAETGKVSVACREAGMSRKAAYLLRRHQRGAGFAHAWDAALTHFDAEWFRKMVETETVRSDRSLAILLQTTMPETYG